MAVPAASSIVSYGGAATSNYLTTPIPPFLAGFYSSNFVTDRINTCAPYRVERIRKNIIYEEENDYPPSDELRKGALFCRSGTWLELLPFENPEDGSTQVKVHGTREENSKFSVVEFISVAMSLVSIRGVETKNFICMDPSGKLYATPSSNYSTECVFLEEMMENYYNLYASCAYGNRNNPWYIELRRSGKPRKGPNTKKRRKASHFLVVHHDLDRVRPAVPNGNDVTDLVVASLFHQPPNHPLFRHPGATTKPPSPHRIANLRAKVVSMDEKKRLLVEKKRRREKKQRRREDRLRKEERIRQARRQELKQLREAELRLRHEQQQAAANRTPPPRSLNPYPTYRPSQSRPQYPTQLPRAAYDPYRIPLLVTPSTVPQHHYHHHHHPQNHQQHQHHQIHNHQRQQSSQQQQYIQNVPQQYPRPNPQQYSQQRPQQNIYQHPPPSQYPQPQRPPQIQPQQRYLQPPAPPSQDSTNYQQNSQRYIPAHTASSQNRQNVNYQRYP